MEILNFSQIVQVDKNFSKLIPFISENITFQKFKKEECLDQKKFGFNLSWEKQEETKCESNENTKENKVKKELNKNLKKSECHKQKIDNKTRLILKGQKVKFKNNILVINGKRYIEGKKLMDFLISNKTQKPKIMQIEEFIKFVNKLPKKNKNYLGECAKNTLF